MVAARARRINVSILQLHMSVQDIEPSIWRRVQVPAALSIAGLHQVIQEVFCWQDYHLYAFEVNDRRFEAPDPEAEGENAERVKLKDLALAPGTEFEYIYDFGDDWHHTILVEQRLPPVPGAQYPVCLEGERAGPPEDCGGPHGYAEMLRALADPTHEEHAEMVDWAGQWTAELFDLRATNRVLKLAFKKGRI